MSALSEREHENTNQLLIFSYQLHYKTIKNQCNTKYTVNVDFCCSSGNALVEKFQLRNDFFIPILDGSACNTASKSVSQVVTIRPRSLRF